MEGEAKIPEGFEAMTAGELIPEGAVWLGVDDAWHLASSVTIGKVYDPSEPRVYETKHAVHIKPIKLNLGDGYRLLGEGDLFPHGYEYLSTYNGEWELGGLVGRRYQAKIHGTCRAKIPIRVKGAPIEPVEFPKMPESPRCLWEGWRSCSSEEASRMLSGSHSRDLLRVEYWDPGFKRWLGAGAGGVDRDGHEPFKYRVRWLSQNDVTGATKETGAAPNWHDNLFPDIPTPKDPKTKYHRPMYPAWNDTEVHTDANGHQYINVDVYSVLAAFDPEHEVAHAVKKLLAAGSRDKGSKIQDYREAIISIEAAIYRAEIEGGNG